MKSSESAAGRPGSAHWFLKLAGPTLASLAAASFAQGQPNLAPYKPPGWSAPIVVSNVTGSTDLAATDASGLSPTESLYVNWAVVNNGNSATAARFYVEEYVDGVLWDTWQHDSLEANTYTAAVNDPIGPLAPGTHTVAIVVDSTHAITENSESDNTYTKTIKVLGGGARNGAKIKPLQGQPPSSVGRGQSRIFPLSGRVMNGAVAGSTVRFYALNSNGSKGSLLASTVTDVNGSYVLSIASAPSDSILAESSGGQYRDEATGASIALSHSDVLTAVFSARTSQVAVTPLTHMSAARARALAAGGEALSTAVSASNAGVGEQYQIPDIVQLLPVAADSSTEVRTSTRDQRDYGLVLAGIAQEAHGLGVRAIDLAQALAADMSDGILDGKAGSASITIAGSSGSEIEADGARLASALGVNAGTSSLQTGIDIFVGGARNKTGLDVFDILNQPVPVGRSGAYVTGAVLPAARSGKSYGAGPLGVAGGTPPYFWTFAAGTAHPGWLGLTLAGQFGGNAPLLPPATTLTISPVFVATVSDSSKPAKTVSVPLTITITDPPPELHPFDRDCPLNQFCNVVVATADGSNPPFTFFQGSLAYGVLPPGLHLDASGTVSGTATGPVKPYPFAVCVTDVIGTETCEHDPTITVTDAKIAPTSASFGASGGGGSVTVSASQGLPWTAVSNDGWIAITSGSSGSGNGTVNYSVSANASPTQRTGTMTIAGLTFTVTEAAATGGGGGLSAFDGTYDMTVWYSYNGTPTSQTASQYFIVTNGAISSSFGDLGGSVLDTAGDVRFTGPCPTNSKGATYTGQLFASSPKSGNGAYVCGDGLTNNWSVSNGR